MRATASAVSGADPNLVKLHSAGTGNCVSYLEVLSLFGNGAITTAILASRHKTITD